MYTLARALHRLAIPEATSSQRSYLDLMAKLCQLATRHRGNQSFDADVTSREGPFGESAGLQCFLNIEAIVGDIGYELRMGLCLVPAAHNPEADLNPLLFHERWNDCV